MVGYVDAGYMSDPHNARSQTGFVFLYGGAAISWRSVKQTLVATSTNHSEIIALYEAARECIWLRRMIDHIQKSCGMNAVDTPTIIYEDNAACVVQMHMGYVKSNLTKHIAPKFFGPHELQKSGEIKVLQAKSCDNLVDLFTKSLPASSFHKCVRGIGMRRLRELQSSGGINPETIAHNRDSEDHESVLMNRPNINCCTLFSLMSFSHWVFLCKVFNEATGAT